MSRALATSVTVLSALMLAACTTSDVLEPSAMVGNPPTAASTAPSPVAPGGETVAAIDSSARIQFAPIVGSTVEAVTPLTERLATRAKERGIGLARSDEPGASYVLKGYLSAITEGKETTVIYVWDVLDTSGNRLHRIQGQQKVAGRGEGWAAVPDTTMQTIADVTVDQLALWLGGRTG
ncbi:hypothetical protein MesoLjLc_33870 [Mesorhizobium sp. L-8-10]|uniref:hypothetical protein n=1 Tax=Mesorhizobium sp. L-8-10 TaxID=2744523 RepID=UPI00192614E9|nr:hypothetical protein [Mesorhizobium sp. L-8-10]BCH31457.1 hypothetical protein MesoLjLc_33870 [Mesorhizobium sp. L-8-10]